MKRIIVITVSDDDDDKPLTCSRCGQPYTMREFRQYSWQTTSPICWRCQAEDDRRWLDEAFPRLRTPRKQPKT